MKTSIAVLALMATTLECVGQSPDLSILNVKNFLAIRNTSGNGCLVRVAGRDSQKLVVNVTEDATVCGARGRRLTITQSDVVDISPYREKLDRRRINGLKMAGACVAIITGGIALGFGTGNGAAGLSVIGGGLAALTWHSFRHKVRYTVTVTKFP